MSDMDTNALIAQLSREAQPKARLRSPAWFAPCLIAVLLVYGIAVQFHLHIRADIAVQFTRMMFVVEIALLALLTLTSAIAGIYAMYPDVYQKSWLLRVPYAAFALLAVFILMQLIAMPADPRMVIPQAGIGMECAICIASVALIPSGLMFWLMRKGASVHPLQAGSFAVLAASGIGCLTLRLSEANDSLMHLACWHYLPTLLFAVLGATIGKWVLKW